MVHTGFIKFKKLLNILFLKHIFFLHSIAKAELPRQFSEGSDLSERSKLQRQKAQSRKTFKLRKTRKDQRKLKTTCEPLGKNRALKR